MTTIIPETLTRLQASAFVDNAELAVVGRSKILREAAKRLAEKALHKIATDFIRFEEYLGFQTQAMRLDVYVLSPPELAELIVAARREGAEDTQRFMPRSFELTLSALHVEIDGLKRQLLETQKALNEAERFATAYRVPRAAKEWKEKFSSVLSDAFNACHEASKKDDGKKS